MLASVFCLVSVRGIWGMGPFLTCVFLNKMATKIQPTAIMVMESMMVIRVVMEKAEVIASSSSESESSPEWSDFLSSVRKYLEKVSLSLSNLTHSLSPFFFLTNIQLVSFLICPQSLVNSKWYCCHSSPSRTVDLSQWIVPLNVCSFRSRYAGWKYFSRGN